MTYLWINPVSERMVSEQNLKRILTEHQLTQVRCQEDWGGIVLKQYAELMEHADGTVADARCPEAVNLIERYNEERNLSIQVADIEPILIHCARELSARADLADGEDHHYTLPDPGRTGKCAGIAAYPFCELEGFFFRTRRIVGAGTGGQSDPAGIFYGTFCAGGEFERSGRH